MFSAVIKPLVVNITILFSLVFNANLFFPFRRKMMLTWKQKMMYGVVASFTAVLCMMYPIQPLAKTNFDFRMIVILVTTLYIGKTAGLLCTLTVVIGRFMIGGPFAYAGVTVSVFAYVVGMLFRSSFFNVKRKILYGLMIVFIYLILYIATIMYAVPPLSWRFYVVYFAFFIAMFVALVSVIERLIQFNEQFDDMIYVDKLATVSEMAASFAHEVRNPLTTVRGFVQFLSKDTTDENVKKFAPIILEELDRTNEIITEYLALAKPAPFQLQKVNIDDILHTSVHLLSPLGTMTNVSLHLYTEGKSDVYGDAHYLKQALLNVMKNGIEAIEYGGIVTIHKTVDEKEKIVIITIRDTGKGMTKEQLKKIGLPYYTTKSKGTGLGSMITSRLIRQMGGTIAYESRLNEGTTVTITLPLYEGD
ncbi:sporulation kinase [Anoxybacillus gonensis]|uniref:histidine kinase n=1 Tax=Anoxybacillus gonensis TaxID=198467 RepID=A0AAW7TGV9_9BACL|nr:ATP-binding protein [Anoxybacillus gonensis]AKS37851.1 sporulation kinase [Anoxybacillus gonensis]KGP61850.1 sporulation kinase [Anoxybacillus gonensis]MDO0877560.1 ATP-binding protein [Anoxybacillus gonensis]